MSTTSMTTATPTRRPTLYKFISVTETGVPSEDTAEHTLPQLKHPPQCPRVAEEKAVQFSDENDSEDENRGMNEGRENESDRVDRQQQQQQEQEQEERPQQNDDHFENENDSLENSNNENSDGADDDNNDNDDGYERQEEEEQERNPHHTPGEYVDNDPLPSSYSSVSLFTNMNEQSHALLALNVIAKLQNSLNRAEERADSFTAKFLTQVEQNTLLQKEIGNLTVQLEKERQINEVLTRRMGELEEALRAGGQDHHCKATRTRTTEEKAGEQEEQLQRSIPNHYHQARRDHHHQQQQQQQHHRWTTSDEEDDVAEMEENDEHHYNSNDDCRHRHYNNDPKGDGQLAPSRQAAEEEKTITSGSKRRCTTQQQENNDGEEVGGGNFVVEGEEQQLAQERDEGYLSMIQKKRKKKRPRWITRGNDGNDDRNEEGVEVMAERLYDKQDAAVKTNVFDSSSAKVPSGDEGKGEETLLVDSKQQQQQQQQRSGTNVSNGGPATSSSSTSSSGSESDDHDMSSSSTPSPPMAFQNRTGGPENQQLALVMNNRSASETPPIRNTSMTRNVMYDTSTKTMTPASSFLGPSQPPLQQQPSLFISQMYAAPTLVYGTAPPTVTSPSATPNRTAAVAAAAIAASRSQLAQLLYRENRTNDHGRSGCRSRHPAFVGGGDLAGGCTSTIRARNMMMMTKKAQNDCGGSGGVGTGGASLYRPGSPALANDEAASCLLTMSDPKYSSGKTNATNNTGGPIASPRTKYGTNSNSDGSTGGGSKSGSTDIPGKLDDDTVVLFLTRLNLPLSARGMGFQALDSLEVEGKTSASPTINTATTNTTTSSSSSSCNSQITLPRSFEEVLHLMDFLFPQPEGEGFHLRLYIQATDPLRRRWGMRTRKALRKYKLEHPDHEAVSWHKHGMAWVPPDLKSLKAFMRHLMTY